MELVRENRFPSYYGPHLCGIDTNVKTNIYETVLFFRGIGYMFLLNSDNSLHLHSFAVVSFSERHHRRF